MVNRKADSNIPGENSLMQEVSETHSVGEIICTYRERAGLSQEELAEIIHVSKGKLVHWENNETIPRISMVGRLIGALDIPDEELFNAVYSAREQKRINDAKIQTEEQAKIQVENEEVQRITHKQKAINLLLLGTAGFVAGVLLTFIIGAYKAANWCSPRIGGAACAGIPLGFRLLFGEVSFFKRRPLTPWEREQRRKRGMVEWVVVICFYLLMFVIAYFVGLFSFPNMLLYHAYKAGKKGTAYRIIMFIAFLLAALFYGILACCVVISVFTG